MPPAFLRSLLLVLVPAAAAALWVRRSGESVAPASDRPAPGPGEVDLGRVSEGRRIPFVAELRNPLPRSARVRVLGSHCSCIRLELPPSGLVAEPGALVRIPGTLDTSGRAGPVERGLEIGFEGPPSASVRLRVRALVDAPLVVEADRLEFARAAPGVAAPAEFAVRRTDTLPWRVTAAEMVEPGEAPVPLAVETTEAEADRTVHVRLTHPGAPTPGLHVGSVLVHTTHPAAPTLLLEAAWTVESGIRAIPARVPLGYVSRGREDGVSVAVRLLDGRGEEVPVREALVEGDGRGEDASDGPAFACRFVTHPDGRREVRVSLRPGAPRGRRHGVLRLVPDRPGLPVCVVPLDAYATP